MIERTVNMIALISIHNICLEMLAVLEISQICDQSVIALCTVIVWCADVRARACVDDRVCTGLRAHARMDSIVQNRTQIAWSARCHTTSDFSGNQNYYVTCRYMYLVRQLRIVAYLWQCS